MGGQKSEPINLTTETNQSKPTNQQTPDNRQTDKPTNSRLIGKQDVLLLSISISLYLYAYLCAYLRACASVQERNDHYALIQDLPSPPLFRSVKILVAFLQFFFEFFLGNFFLNFFFAEFHKAFFVVVGIFERVHFLG